MTLDEMKRMAQEVGGVTDVLIHGRHDNTVFTSTELIEFVDWVAMRERERCAQLCETIAHGPSNVVLGVALECAEKIRRME